MNLLIHCDESLYYSWMGLNIKQTLTSMFSLGFGFQIWFLCELYCNRVVWQTVVADLLSNSRKFFRAVLRLHHHRMCCLSFVPAQYQKKKGYQKWFSIECNFNKNHFPNYRIQPADCVRNGADILWKKFCLDAQQLRLSRPCNLSCDLKVEMRLCDFSAYIFHSISFSFNRK